MRSIDTTFRDWPDSYLLLEAGELVEYADKYAKDIRANFGSDSSWTGDTYAAFQEKLVVGDENLVQSSEEYLRSIEDQVPMSRGWRNVDDVVGALPNVPAYLAGHPQSMRRRVRTMRDTAPLSVFVDLTSSGGIDSAEVTRRGVVLLALVRLLVEHRAVELWVGSALGPRSTYSRASWTTAWRVDTAPLDLARAAYHVGATAMSRGFAYGVCEGRGSGGRWPFNDYGLHVRTAEQRLAAVFPGQEVMYVPPIYLSDPLTADPVGWLRRVLEKYVTGGEER